MSDLIRKAVELADGFRQFCGLYQIGDEWNEAETDDDNPQQWFLDALAVQLVRQVDALEGLAFDSKGGKFLEVIIWDFRPGNNRMTGSARGQDRTMNTIKAIVESGVLSGAKSYESAAALDRIEELEAEVERLNKRHDEFLQEFWATNAENAKLSAICVKHSLT